MTPFGATPGVAPRRKPTLSWLAAAALLLYLAAVVAGPYVTTHWLSPLLAHGQSALPQAGHPFADARPWLGLPNAADTLSNLPFALLALCGWGALRRASVPAAQREALQVFFAGLLLTALGSGVYHAVPAAWSLVLDRMGMAVAFAGMLGLASAERLDARAARWLLRGLLPLALLAAALPALAGNLLPWGVVQYGGMAWVLAMALRRPLPGALGVSLAAVIAWYALAKGLEGADAALFAASGEWVSGHTLKHLAAAAAALPVLAALRRAA